MVWRCTGRVFRSQICPYLIKILCRARSGSAKYATRLWVRQRVGNVDGILHVVPTLRLLATCGRNGDMTSRFSSLPQCMDLKNWCFITSSEPFWPYPRRFLTSRLSRAFRMFSACELRYSAFVHHHKFSLLPSGSGFIKQYI